MWANIRITLATMWGKMTEMSSMLSGESDKYMVRVFSSSRTFYIFFILRRRPFVFQHTFVSSLRASDDRAIASVSSKSLTVVPTPGLAFLLHFFRFPSFPAIVFSSPHLPWFPYSFPSAPRQPFSVLHRIYAFRSVPVHFPFVRNVPTLDESVTACFSVNNNDHNG